MSACGCLDRRHCFAHWVGLLLFRTIYSVLRLESFWVVQPGHFFLPLLVPPSGFEEVYAQVEVEECRLIMIGKESERHENENQLSLVVEMPPNQVVSVHIAKNHSIPLIFVGIFTQRKKI